MPGVLRKRHDGPRIWNGVGVVIEARFAYHLHRSAKCAQSGFDAVAVFCNWHNRIRFPDNVQDGNLGID